MDSCHVPLPVLRSGCDYTTSKEPDSFRELQAARKPEPDVIPAFSEVWRQTKAALHWRRCWSCRAVPPILEPYLNATHWPSGEPLPSQVVTAARRPGPSLTPLCRCTAWGLFFMLLFLLNTAFDCARIAVDHTEFMSFLTRGNGRDTVRLEINVRLASCLVRTAFAGLEVIVRLVSGAVAVLCIHPGFLLCYKIFRFSMYVEAHSHVKMLYELLVHDKAPEEDVAALLESQCDDPALRSEGEWYS